MTDAETQETYVTWVPEFDGHTPPNWQPGMDRVIRLESGLCMPSAWPWPKGQKCRVPLSAVKTPFDAQAWLSDAYKKQEAGLLPEGVTLPAREDWADRLARTYNKLHSKELDSKRFSDFLRVFCRPVDDD